MGGRTFGGCGAKFDYRVAKASVLKNGKAIRVCGNLSNKVQARAKLTQVARSLVTQNGSNQIVAEFKKLQE